ncbi:MAG: cyclase family protein [Gammaproteobacteria bacterium]|nr:cyclase family protein [Gammaproteobacteria bacterium]
MQLIDLSHTIEDGLVTYKGLPPPVICDFLSREASKQHYAEGTTFQIGRIELCSNTGTYLDSPWHRFAEGKDLSALDLASVAHLDGVKVQVEEGRTVIDVDVFRDVDVKGRAVLVETGWSRHWNTETYYEGHPFLTEAAALHLRDAGVRLVGIDSYNIDDVSGKERPVHTTLLGAEILIVEHMTNLAQVPAGDFRFYAVPVKIKGMGTFPVRAFVEVD